MTEPLNIKWEDLHHSELTTEKLYDILKLRAEVFVVEQKISYADPDGLDLAGENRHVFGWHNDKLVAYARILKSDDDSEPTAIGRVVISQTLRGARLGQHLMSHTVESCRKHWPDNAIYVSAQAHLQVFYERCGFTPVTDVYAVHKVPHIGMRLEVPSR